MKILGLVLFVFSLLIVSSPAFADDMRVIQECLARWEKHPFGKEPTFKILKPGVKVLGIGKDLVDSEVTESPRLVLIKPSVNVLTKNVYKLYNPNGWYCFKANVTVIGKSVVEAHCKAKLTYANGEANIVGSNSREAEGVNVLGKSVVNRIGCE